MKREDLRDGDEVFVRCTYYSKDNTAFKSGRIIRLRRGGRIIVDATAEECYLGESHCDGNSGRKND